MRAFLQKYLNAISWALAFLVTVVGVVAWAQNNNWQFVGLSNYELFPVFGIVAFSLMWCHYVVGGIKAGFALDKVEHNKLYFEVTAGVVLVALLLHPTVLIWQLWRDGFGLPPGSYSVYVAPGLLWVVYLGTLSLLVFLSFEFRRWFSKKFWWKYVLYANDIATWAIYYHGLRLGADVAAPWLKQVWLFYGFILAAAFISIYSKKFTALKYTKEDQSGGSR